MFANRLKKYKNGFSLIETLLVLGVLAVILIAAFVIYPKVRDNTRASNEATNIRMIQTNVRNTYLNKGNYSGLGGGKDAANGPDRGLANLARVFPTTMNGGDFSKNATVTSSWGGDVWVWVRPALTTPKGDIPTRYSFAILYEGVPAGVCVPLATMVGNDFASVSISGEEIMTATGIDVEAITRSCEASDPNAIRLRLTST